MAVNLEWTCKHCGHEFESKIGICKQCGKTAARAYRTPIGISPKSMYKKVDKMVEAEFKARGIANYTNFAGTPKVTFQNSYASSYGGFAQPPITAGWGKDSLNLVNQQYGTNFQLPQNISSPPERDPEAPIVPRGIQQAWSTKVPTLTERQ